MRQITNGLITLQASEETCDACPLLVEAQKQPLIVNPTTGDLKAFVNLSSGALKELLQVYRHEDYEVDLVFLPEIEWAINGPFDDKDFKIVILEVGGQKFMVAQSLLEKIPYFQASSRFSGQATLVFDRDPDAFAAYLDFKRNPRLASHVSKQEGIFWMEPIEHCEPVLEPVHHVEQGSILYLTSSAQVSMFKGVHRRHTGLFRRVHQQAWDAKEIEIPLDKSMGCLGKVYLRRCSLDQVEQATLRFENGVEFVLDQSMIALENANLDQRNGIVLFGNIGMSWPLVCVEGVLTIKLVAKQKVTTAVVCATMEDTSELRRFQDSSHEWICHLWSSYHAKELTLPEGAIIAVFVKGTQRGGIYHQDKLISLLDETIDCSLPDDWHMINFSMKPILQPNGDLQTIQQPTGHLASDTNYVLRLDKECEIKIYEYAIVRRTSKGKLVELDFGGDPLIIKDGLARLQVTKRAPPEEHYGHWVGASINEY